MPPKIQCAKHFAFSPDARRLLVVDRGFGCLVEIDPPGRTVVDVRHAEMDCGAISADDRWIVGSARRGRSVSLWNASGRREYRLLEGEQGTLAAFSPDGHWLVGASSRESLFFKAPSWKLDHRVTMSGPAANLRQWAFSPDGQLLAVSHDRYRIHLIDVSSGRELGQLPAGYFETWLRFNADGTELACMDSRMGIQAWNLQALRERLFESGLGWDAEAR